MEQDTILDSVIDVLSRAVKEQEAVQQQAETALKEAKANYEKQTAFLEGLEAAWKAIRPSSAEKLVEALPYNKNHPDRAKLEDMQTKIAAWEEDSK